MQNLHDIFGYQASDIVLRLARYKGNIECQRAA